MNSDLVTTSMAISDLPKLTNTLGKEEMEYNNKPSNYYQKIMREESNKVFNHIGTKHKDFVINTIKLVPDGGNHKDLPEGYGNSRNFNEICLNM